MTSNADKLRQTLEVFIAEKCEEHLCRFAEHRHIQATSADAIEFLPKFHSPRPPEPVPAQPGLLSRWFGWTDADAGTHLQALWKHQKKLSEWKKEKAEHDVKTGKQREVARRIMAGDPVAIRWRLENKIKSINWKFPVKFQALNVGSEFIVLSVNLPDLDQFPDRLPGLAMDGRSAPFTKRSIEDLRADAELYLMSVSIRMVAECFSQFPRQKTIKIVAAAKPYRSESLLIYERHRWTTADMSLAHNNNPRSLHEQLCQAI